MSLEIVFLSNHYIAISDIACAVLDMLKRHKEITPTHFDCCEPLRRRLQDDGTEFINTWVSQGQRGFGTIIWKRRPKPGAEGMADFGRGKYPFFNRFSVIIPFGRLESYEPFLQDAMDFFGRNRFLFGRMCLKAEYYRNNILENVSYYFNQRGEKVLHFPGAISPILAVGLDLTKHIPGLYWRTLLGRTYADWFGPDKIMTAPTYLTTMLPDGAVCLQLYERPELFTEPSSLEVVEAVKRHLGEDAFFDIRDIERKTAAPEIDVGEITL